MAKKSKIKFSNAGIKYGYASGIEHEISLQIELVTGQRALYEPLKIPYQRKVSHYTPDFLLPNGIFIETKGRFIAQDRTKHRLIKEQHPLVDIRFVFTNAKQKISKGSKTTYADWCDKFGFKYSEGSIPAEWFNEKIYKG